MFQGRSSICQVCEKEMSGKSSRTYRWDLESVVTRRYERRETAAAMAAFP